MISKYTNSEDNGKAQKVIRLRLVNLLQRSNGTITEREYLEAFNHSRDRLDKLKLRLFHVASSGELEWKPDISSETDLARKIGILRADIPKKILDLFYHSREPQKLSLFPHITCARKKRQYRDETDFPVFGFDILIRPPTEFTIGSKKKNNFVVGRHAFAYFIHANDNNYMLRANMGDDIMRFGVNQYLDKEIAHIYDAIRNFYYNRQYHDLVYKLCEVSNKAIRTWHFSGV